MKSCCIVILLGRKLIKIMLIEKKISLLMQKMFVHRWLLGLIVLVLCVILELHGSSIGLYAKIFDYPDSNIVIFGKNRAIRSDEWLVFTPFAFSQYFTNFAYFGDIVRGTATDMFMVYGQPVWDIGMIFRPTQWGYLFLKPGTGLSFFWMSRWIFLLLISFEFGRVLTNDKKYMSFAYAMMVAFAPIVQWWFSVNAFVEILMFGQGSILLWNSYLLSGKFKFRLLYILGIYWCAGGYLFSIYPAWQVPFAYIFLSLFIWLAIKHKAQFAQRKGDLVFWGIGLILLLVPVIHVLQNSWDTIQLVKNTEYPGSRQSAGGALAIRDLFVYGNSLFLPYYDVTRNSNNCEAARFFSMAPLGMLLVSRQIFHKKNDMLLIMLVVVNVIFMFWGIVGMPLWLSNLLLLSNTTEERIISAIGFLDMLILFRALAIIDFKDFFQKKINICVAAGMAAFIVYCGSAALPTWISSKMAAIEFTVLFYLFILLLSGKTNTFVKWISIVMLVAGLTVNPISHGVASVYDNPIGEKISSIANQDRGLWLVEGSMREIIDYPIMFGAPTINSVNVYPDLARWGKLSSAEADKKIYNRYAHIIVNLTDREKTAFSLKFADLMQIDLNLHDLKFLQVKYILTRNRLSYLQSEEVCFLELFKEHGFYIYKVKYS